MANLEDTLAAEFPLGDTEGTPEAVEETPETPEQVEPEVEQAEGEQHLYAGKYESPEELEKAYSALQSKLGQQGDELGKLRSQVEEQLQALQSQLQQQPTPFPAAEPDWLESVDLSDPRQAHQVVNWVLENQPFHYQTVMGEWFNVDPMSASNFQTQVALAQQRSELEEKYAPLMEIPDRLQAQSAADNNLAKFEQAWASIGATNPDLGEYAEGIIETASTVPALAKIFQDGDADQVAATLQILLDGARGRRSAAEAIASQQNAEAAGAAKSRANLTKANTTAGAQSKPQTSADRFYKLWDDAWK